MVVSERLQVDLVLRDMNRPDRNGLRALDGVYAALMFAARTTLPHFSISATTSLA
jgi:hypothetical protein